MLTEGKTKQIWELATSDKVLIVSKDRITAHNGVHAHDLQEKATLSTQTTCNIFTILNEAGT